MKKLTFITSVFSFIGFISFAQEASYSDNIKSGMNSGFNISQELRFNVRGNYARPVLEDNLKKAKNLGDIIPYYPVNWISHYKSSEISITTNGKVLKARGSDDKLNSEQIQILKAVGPASEIGITVKYKATNAVTGVLEDHTMNVLMTVVPDVEAEYPGGREQIRKYLQEAAINKISQGEIKPAIVRFIINEEGAAVNALVTKSTGNDNTDKLLIEAVKNMPKWKPAQNSKGKKVKQDFVFLIEMGGC